MERKPAMDRQADNQIALARGFVRMCRRNLLRAKVADSSGLGLTGGGLLAGSLALRRVLRREVLAQDERYVGILLPPSVGSVLANAALALDRRIAVNLNYTLSSELVNACLAQCGIRHVLTSPRLMERFPLKLDACPVMLEDLHGLVRRADKLAAAAQTWLWPAAMLERWLGLTAVRPDDVLTVMFTSGSTGEPKGVELTQRNIGSNVAALGRLIRLSGRDVLLGVLPMFHSFGYTTTLWTALMLEPKAVYHYTPLEARQIGQLCRAHGCTVLIAAPTFLRAYLRRCAGEDFRSLEVVFAGAEQLSAELAEAFQRRFGVRPVEGYGATELSPVVAANIPPNRADGSTGGLREGTIGRPLAGIVVKVIDLESGRELGPGRQGMLLVRGPNVMKGYLGRPGLTAEVFRDGWYVTGDVATIDEEGFIRITGRAGRFSKIGGEMVPHLAVEAAIRSVLGLEDEPAALAVTAVPDEKKGERLIVLHAGLPSGPEEIRRRLIDKGLPSLWIPAADAFRQVEAVPLLGTGKLDLERVRELALG